MQSNAWSTRLDLSSAALANQMENLSVTTKDTQPTTSDKSDCTEREGESNPVVASGSKSGEGSSVASQDTSNPQGGMKYAGRENGSPSSAAAAGSPSEMSRESGVQGCAQLKPAAVNMAPMEKHFMKVPPTKKDGRKLFVGGIPSNVSDGEFRAYFEQFGDIVDSVVMYDRDTHRSRGFGFVTFELLSVAENVLTQAKQRGGKLNIHGKDCEVKAAEPKASSHDSHFPGHMRDKRKSHDNRSSTFAKLDLARGPSNGMVHHHQYASYGHAFYPSLQNYQQAYYTSVSPQMNFSGLQAPSYNTMQVPYEQDQQSYNSQGSPQAYVNYAYPPGYYQQTSQYPVYATGYPNGYSPEEPPYQDKSYAVSGAQEQGVPVIPGYGYPNMIPGPGGQPQVVPGVVTVSPHPSYEMPPFGSEGSSTENQNDDVKNSFD